MPLVLYQMVKNIPSHLVPLEVVLSCRQTAVGDPAERLPAALSTSFLLGGLETLPTNRKLRGAALLRPAVLERA